MQKEKEEVLYYIENHLFNDFFYMMPPTFMYIFGAGKEEYVFKHINKFCEENGIENPFSEGDIKVNTYGVGDTMLLEFKYLNIPETECPVNMANYFLLSEDKRFALVFAVELAGKGEIGTYINLYGKDSDEVKNLKNIAYLCAIDCNKNRFNFGQFDKNTNFVQLAIEIFEDHKKKRG